MLSVIVPVYRNQETIPALVTALQQLAGELAGELEAVLVVDGSPDQSLALLGQLLPQAGFRSQLLTLSRNFGSFAAIRAGLQAARGEHLAVMAADLQEPPELMLELHRRLCKDHLDVVVGSRSGRADPLLGRLAAGLFWWCYRSFIQRQMPAGGVDVFACTRAFADQILRLDEANSTLVGLIFWLGFRRGEVAYSRRPRAAGRSAWSFARRLRYLLDSTFAFSDLPIRLLSVIGLGGLLLALGLGAIILTARLLGEITVPGYAATALLIIFFGGLNSLGLGLLGEYLWRTFENTKARPGFLVARHQTFAGATTSTATGHHEPAAPEKGSDDHG